MVAGPLGFLARAGPVADPAVITVTVDAESPVPPFEQLRAQIAGAIRGGVLATGTGLPTVRQLAHDLDLAPNTVARAYRALEADGLVRADGRRGTSVAPVEAGLPDGERRRRLVAAAERYLAEARSLGATGAEAREILASVSEDGSV